MPPPRIVPLLPIACSWSLISGHSRLIKNNPETLVHPPEEVRRVLLVRVISQLPLPLLHYQQCKYPSDRSPSSCGSCCPGDGLYASRRAKSRMYLYLPCVTAPTPQVGPVGCVLGKSTIRKALGIPLRVHVLERAALAEPAS